jgi:hypothetical protein
LLEAHAEARKKGERNRIKEQSSQALADRPARRGGLFAWATRTVRQGTADCPLGTLGLSAPLLRTIRNLVQPKLKTKTDRIRSQARTRRTWDEHCSRGPSATPSRTVRASRTEAKTARPRESTTPTHHRISQTVEAVETRVWEHDMRQPRMLYPKNFAS